MSKRLNFHAGKSLADGMPTKHIGVGGTDLGFLFEGGKQFGRNGRSQWVGGLFGDTVKEFHGSGDWRSPVMMRSSNPDFASKGIVWDNAVAGGRGILNYPMGVEDGYARHYDQRCFSIIPNDALQLPDNRYVATGFRVANWRSDASQEMAHTHSATWFYSDEPHAETWRFAYDVEYGQTTEKNLGYQWWNENREQYFQNMTFLQVPGDDYVYVFGTPEGRHTGGKAGVYLRRCDWRHLWERSKWEFWGFADGRWQWGRHIWPTPILQPTVKGTSIGEINAQYLGGKVRLAYMDGPLGATVRTADAPDSVWSDPVIMIPGHVAGHEMMYAPSLHPWNTDMRRAAFNISSWPHKGDWHRVYGSYTYVADIEPRRRLGINAWSLGAHEFDQYIARLRGDFEERNSADDAVLTQ